MKKNRKRAGSTAQTSGSRMFRIAVTILGLILIAMIILTIVRVSEPFYYYDYEADDLLRSMKNGYYEDVLWEVKSTRSLGNTSNADPDMAVPYALVDYYEAETYYIGHMKAGDEAGAALYRGRMDEAYEKLGEFTFLSEEIDKYLGLEE